MWSGKNFLLFLGASVTLPGIAWAAESPEVAAGTPVSWWIAPVSALVALIVAWGFYKKVMSAPQGNEKMVTIAGHVQEGAYAYLFRQYKIVALVFLIFFVIFVILAYFGVQNPFMPVASLTAGFFSARSVTAYSANRAEPGWDRRRGEEAHLCAFSAEKGKRARCHRRSDPNNRSPGHDTEQIRSSPRSSRWRSH